MGKFGKAILGEIMTERDRIINYVKDVFIESVRKDGRTSVAVIVRDVNREMSLNGNFKNICEALRKPDILELAKVKLRCEIRRDTVKLNSSTNIFVFDW